MTDTVTEKVELDIKPFNEIRAAMAELKAENAAKVFELDTPDGIKGCKAHIRALTKRKASIEAIRKAEKAESLAYGRRVDSVAKELTADVIEMIGVHKPGLDAIEAAEAKRVLELAAKVASVGMPANMGNSAEAVKNEMNRITAIQVDDTWQEAQQEALQLQKETLDTLNTMHGNCVQAEADAAELKALREKDAARDAEDAKRKADEEAKAQAEAKAKADEEAKAKRIEDERVAAEQRKADEEARIKKAEEDAVAKAKADLEAKAKRDEEEAEKRRDDLANRHRITNEIEMALIRECQVPDELATDIAIALLGGEIPHVEVKF